MDSISSLVEQVFRKHGIKLPELKTDISSNLEFRLLFPIDFSKGYKEAKKDFLKSYFNDLLTVSLGNISLAAKRANLHRRHMHRMINDLELDPANHKKELLKPSQYLKDNIQPIIEETLTNFEQDDAIKYVYSNLDDISNLLASHMQPLSYEEAMVLFEREYIEKALRQNSNSITKTAEEMDISERTLYRKISKLQIAVA